MCSNCEAETSKNLNVPVIFTNKSSISHSILCDFSRPFHAGKHNRNILCDIILAANNTRDNISADIFAARQPVVGIHGGTPRRLFGCLADLFIGGYLVTLSTATQSVY